MALTVEVAENRPGIYSITPLGSIDTNTHTVLEATVDSVLSASPKVVILDMEGVTYISSMGLRVIFKLSKALGQSGGKLTMGNLQPQIRKVFEIINVLPSMNIFESVVELDNYLDAMQRKEIGF
ncbi:MAG: STAS domain-containing protein [Candidatus Tritonobacter lacicola]|nr:STAS domain-containing protein [Candidatus Tritonobacter lacicola]